MSPISADLHDSLHKLNQIIAAAEDAIKRFPAATRVYIEVDDKGALEAREIHGRVTLVAQPCVDGEPAGDPRPLRELGAARRVEFAKCIPDFIDAARTAESGLAEEVQEVAAAIEQRLAEEFN